MSAIKYCRKPGALEPSRLISKNTRDIVIEVLTSAAGSPEPIDPAEADRRDFEEICDRAVVSQRVLIVKNPDSGCPVLCDMLAEIKAFAGKLLDRHLGIGGRRLPHSPVQNLPGCPSRFWQSGFLSKQSRAMPLDCTEFAAPSAARIGFFRHRIRLAGAAA